MIVLAVDTTSHTGGVAIRQGGKTISERAIHSPEGFAHLIFPVIEQFLAASGIRLDQIDCFAAASGPGSFTGIRIGLSAVKGLADALGKSAAGVSNLRAMASYGKSERRAVVMDARRSEVFTGIYNTAGDPVIPEAVLKLSAWLGSLDPSLGEFVVPAGSQFRSLLAGSRLKNADVIEAPSNLAAAVAMYADQDAQAGRLLDPAALDANYVRRSDAELFWKDS